MCIQMQNQPQVNQVIQIMRLKSGNDDLTTLNRMKCIVWKIVEHNWHNVRYAWQSFCNVNTYVCIDRNKQMHIDECFVNDSKYAFLLQMEMEKRKEKSMMQNGSAQQFIANGILFIDMTFEKRTPIFRVIHECHNLNVINSH